MKVKFQPDETLSSDEIYVEIRAVKEDENVKKLRSYLDKFGQKRRKLLPVKTTDSIIMLKRNDLIKVEVQATKLTYYTKNEVIQTTGRLYQVLAELGTDFIQVSRHSIINLNYLESIEVGFAGNMIALLANGLKADVSRRYLPHLERELGL